ncbi:ribonuclease H-like domain-containing protein [Xylariaceae sp. FL0594]|nr:ribonuclease H-like domain-containing protein [Xylariaceae sp. FL0594]
MVYIMKFYVEGGCRGNGKPGSIGAAACCLMDRYRGGYRYKAKTEIEAIIMALKWALEKYDTLDSYPRLVVQICSDSRYAIGCTDNWIYMWSQNGWLNSNGYETANRDLVQKASNLDDRVRELGSVEYKWVPRSDNFEADKQCNIMLDEQESQRKHAAQFYQSDSDDPWWYWRIIGYTE